MEKLRGLAALCETYGKAFDRKDIDPGEEQLPDLPPLTELSEDRTILKAQENQRVTNPVATSIAAALGYTKIAAEVQAKLDQSA